MVDSNYLKSLPRSAFRYWPSGDYIKVGSEKTTVRFIFYKIEFTEFESQQLNKFIFYIKEQNQFSVPEFFTEPELLRVLLGCKFNFSKAFEALRSSILWRSQYLQNSYFSLYTFCKDLLNSGSIYFHGRDHRFRPLLVINISRFNFSENSTDSYCNLLCFLLEFAIKKLMMPGQVENWIVITDLCNKGLTSLPISDMKRIIKTLQDNFRCRMSVNYVVNSPGSIYFIWRIAKKFIEEHTIKKIRIEKNSDPKEIFAHFNKNQVEKKYGGTAPNLTQFWPPTFPEGSLDAEGISIDTNTTNKDTYFDYFPEEVHKENIESIPSEISSCMGSISEKFELEFPNSFVDEGISRLMQNEFEEKQRESIYSQQSSYSIQEYSEKINLSPCAQSVMSSYSIEQADICYEESNIGPEIKEATNNIIVDEQSPSKPISMGKRVCKICSKKSCVIY